MVQNSYYVFDQWKSLHMCPVQLHDLEIFDRCEKKCWTIAFNVKGPLGSGVKALDIPATKLFLSTSVPFWWHHQSVVSSGVSGRCGLITNENVSLFLCFLLSSVFFFSSMYRWGWGMTPAVTLSYHLIGLPTNQWLLSTNAPPLLT